MRPQVSFATKLQTINGRPAVRLKARVGRVDCNLRPHQHAWYNSDLFVGMLNSAYRAAIGGQLVHFTDELPAAVTIDDSKFWAVVTVTLPADFTRG